MHGIRLEVDAHMVTVATPNLRNLNSALEKAQVSPDHHTVSSLAAAEAVMSREQKEAGTVLIDIGAGTTNIIVIEDGEVQHIAVLPIGGMHITNDLAIGLKTDLDVAEQVKVKHAQVGQDYKKPTITLSVNNNTHNFSADDVLMVTEARVEELFDYVDRELQKIRRSRKLPGGVVITGGTAKLPGIAEFAKDKLQLPARIGKLQNVTGLVDTVEDTSYYTVVGLMLLDMLLPSEHSSEPTQSSSQKAMFAIDNLWKRFKR
jgi:cell division protein FtsA